MEITVLGSAGGQAPGQNLTGFRLGAEVLLDAGTSGLQLSLAEQRRIRHVLLTHSHLDHVNSLPFLLDNLVGRISDPVTIYGPDTVLEMVHQHIFNGTIWPDFTVLPTPAAPIARLQPIASGQPVTIGPYTVETVPVEHSVPAVAYLVTSDTGTVVFSGDTGPTQALWERAGRLTDLKAVFIEASFPNSWQAFATKTGHLTPADITRELAKIQPAVSVPVYLYHVKPDFLYDIAREARQISSAEVRVLQTGETIKI